MRIGYIRVSTPDQNPARQLENEKLERVFTDYASGKTAARPQLAELLAFAREGDTVVVDSMDRLARNLTDLRRIVFGLTTRGVHVHFIKGNLTFTGDDDLISKLLLNVMGAFAEFDLAQIKERQREGIALKKAAGGYKGKKRKLPPDLVDELKRRVASKSELKSLSALAREYGIGRQTLYRYLATQQPATDAERETR